VTSKDTARDKYGVSSKARTARDEAPLRSEALLRAVRRLALISAEEE